MQISSINAKAISNNYQNTPAEQTNSKNTISADFDKIQNQSLKQKVYSSNLAALGINFKGLPDEQKTLPELKNEYR